LGDIRALVETTLSKPDIQVRRIEDIVWVPR
jgi:hypothetical protein